MICTCSNIDGNKIVIFLGVVLYYDDIYMYTFTD